MLFTLNAIAMIKILGTDYLEKTWTFLLYICSSVNFVTLWGIQEDVNVTMTRRKIFQIHGTALRTITSGTVRDLIICTLVGKINFIYIIINFL